jgi:type 1 fimbriae regulatory protein FimB
MSQVMKRNITNSKLGNCLTERDTMTTTETVDPRRKNFLNEREMSSFLGLSKHGRHGVRNYAMALLSYRHGLRVSELVGMQLADLDLTACRLFVKRAKGSLSTMQPLDASEVRAVKAWLKVRERSVYVNSPFLFVGDRGPFTRQALNYIFAEIGKRAGMAVHVHPHMLRHSTGFHLANKGCDTRLIQDYLGHRDLRYTELYTRTAVTRFVGLWR